MDFRLSPIKMQYFRMGMQIVLKKDCNIMWKKKCPIPLQFLGNKTDITRTVLWYVHFYYFTNIIHYYSPLVDAWY